MPALAAMPVADESEFVGSPEQNQEPPQPAAGPASDALTPEEIAVLQGNQPAQPAQPVSAGPVQPAAPAQPLQKGPESDTLTPEETRFIKVANLKAQKAGQPTVKDLLANKSNGLDAEDPVGLYRTLRDANLLTHDTEQELVDIFDAQMKKGLTATGVVKGALSAAPAIWGFLKGAGDTLVGGALASWPAAVIGKALGYEGLSKEAEAEFAAGLDAMGVNYNTMTYNALRAMSKNDPSLSFFKGTPMAGPAAYLARPLGKALYGEEFDPAKMTKAEAHKWLLTEVAAQDASETAVTGEGAIAKHLGLGAEALQKQGLAIDPTVASGMSSTLDPINALPIFEGPAVAAKLGAGVAFDKLAQLTGRGLALGADVAEGGATVANKLKTALTIAGAGHGPIGGVAGAAIPESLRAIAKGADYAAEQLTRPEKLRSPLLNMAKRGFVNATGGAIVSAPFAAITPTDKEAGQMLATGTALGLVGGEAHRLQEHAVQAGLNAAGNLIGSVYDAAGANKAPAPAEALKPFGEDKAADALHAQAMDKLTEADPKAANLTNWLRYTLSKLGSRLYLVPAADYDAMLGTKGSAGYFLDEGTRNLLVRFDGTSPEALLHEPGHALIAAMLPAYRDQFFKAIKNSMTPEEFAQRKADYEADLNKGRAPGEQITLDDNRLLHEVGADLLGHILRKTPLDGLPPGMVQRGMQTLADFFDTTGLSKTALGVPLREATVKAAQAAYNDIMVPGVAQAPQAPPTLRRISVKEGQAAQPGLSGRDYVFGKLQREGWAALTPAEQGMLANAGPASAPAAPTLAAVLEKVRKTGVNSLTPEEKAVLTGPAAAPAAGSTGTAGGTTTGPAGSTAGPAAPAGTGGPTGAGGGAAATVTANENHLLERFVATVNQDGTGQKLEMQPDGSFFHAEKILQPDGSYRFSQTRYSRAEVLEDALSHFGDQLADYLNATYRGVDAEASVSNVDGNPQLTIQYTGSDGKRITVSHQQVLDSLRSGKSPVQQVPSPGLATQLPPAASFGGPGVSHPFVPPKEETPPAKEPPVKAEVPTVSAAEFKPAPEPPKPAAANLRVSPEDQAGLNRGERSDIGIQEAAAALTNAPAEQKGIFEQLREHLRQAQGDVPPVEIVYNAVTAEGDPTKRTPRRADQAADLSRTEAQKLMVPTAFVVTNDGRIIVVGKSPDKVLSNAMALVRGAEGKGVLVPYDHENGALTPAGQAAFNSDLQTYLRNQNAGYSGAGKSFVRPADLQGGFIPKENPNYRPTALDETKANFINMALGEPPPKTARVTKGIVPMQERVAALTGINIKAHKADPTKFANVPIRPALKPGDVRNAAVQTYPSGLEISERNPLRQAYDRAGVDTRNLIEASERVYLDQIKSVKPRPESQFRAPVTDLAAANFMPRREGAGRLERPEDIPIRRFGARVTGAPLRRQEITGITDQSHFDTPHYRELQATHDRIAEAMGLKPDHVDRLFGGWKDTINGLHSRETSLRSNLPDLHDHEDARTFAALMGALAPEIQNGMMLVDYEHPAKNGREMTFAMKDDDAAEALSERLTEYGFSGYSYDPATKEFTLAVFDNQINAFKKLASEQSAGIRQGSTTGSKAYLDFPQSTDYRGAIEDGLQRHPENRALRDLAGEAFARLDAAEGRSGLGAAEPVKLPAHPEDIPIKPAAPPGAERSFMPRRGEEKPLDETEQLGNKQFMPRFFSALEKHVGELPEDISELPGRSVKGRSFPARTIRNKEGNVIKEIPARTEEDKTYPATSTGEQVMARLQKAGVTQEEMQWSGIENFLRGKKQVTRKELADFVLANKVEVHEVTKGAPRTTWELDPSKGGGYRMLDRQSRETLATLEVKNGEWYLYDETHHQMGGPYGIGHSHLGMDAGTRMVGEERSGEAKFGDYTLPGGENYREILFTLPGQRPNKETANQIGKRLFGDDVSLYDRPGHQQTHIENELQVNRAAQEAQTYKSPHWDETNVLAHARVADHETTDGQSVLLGDEIQSDWHQKGREAGYEDPRKTEEKQRELMDRWREADQEITQIQEKFREAGYHGEDYFLQEQSRLKSLLAKREQLVDDLLESKRVTGAVPNAPFKKSWHEFVFKNLLAEAVAEGKDYLAWTPGDIQAERYDLSKQIRRIDFVPKEEGDYSLGDLTAWDHDGVIAMYQKNIEPSQIADYIGKEPAEKLGREISSREQEQTQWKIEKAPEGHWIIRDPDGAEFIHADSEAEARLLRDEGTRDMASISGLDLKIGGEGMRGFYDKIVRDFANAYVKQWGSKVENIVLDTPNGETTVQAVPITDAMRQSLPESGQPMFMARQGEGEGKTGEEPSDIPIRPVLGKKEERPLEPGEMPTAADVKPGEPVPEGVTAPRDNPMSALNILYSNRSPVIKNKPPGLRSKAEVGEDLKQAAIEHWGRIITSDNITPEEKASIIANGTAEVLAALHHDPDENASHWYTDDIARAMAIMGVLHPELHNEELAKAAGFPNAEAASLGMALAMAITSQEQTVKLNSRYAQEQFAALKRDGKFDSSKQYGKTAESISGNLDLANELLQTEGWKGLQDLIEEPFTVAELSDRLSKITGRKMKVAGRVGDPVRGAAIFGQKIGQGFLQNIRGNFEPVTIDLWMRRTWGRWTGDVVGEGVNPETLARFLRAARQEKIPLPKEIEDFRPVKDYRDNGSEYWTLRPEDAKKLANTADNKELRTAVHEWADKHAADFQRRYQAVKEFPVKPEHLAKLRDGTMSLDRLADLQRAALDRLQDRWDNLQKKPKGKVAWREAALRRQGHTEMLTKEDINKTKPEWAYAANVISDSLEPTDVPSDQDRALISEVVNGIRQQLKEQHGKDMTNADIQATLWFPEKDIWAKLANKKPTKLKQSYAKEFQLLAEEAGRKDEALAAAAEADRQSERIRAERESGRRGGSERAGAGAAPDRGSINPGPAEAIRPGTGGFSAPEKSGPGSSSSSGPSGPDLSFMPIRAAQRPNPLAHLPIGPARGPSSLSGVPIRRRDEEALTE